MEAKELRIGNLLQDKVTGTVLKVIELSEDKIITYVIDRSKFPLKDGWKAEPIPLTEQVLVDCGFTWKNGYGYTHKSIKGNLFKSIDGTHFMLEYYDEKIKIDSFHLLQNTFKIKSNGQELEYKPKN